MHVTVNCQLKTCKVPLLLSVTSGHMALSILRRFSIHRKRGYSELALLTIPALILAKNWRGERSCRLSLTFDHRVLDGATRCCLFTNTKTVFRKSRSPLFYRKRRESLESYSYYRRRSCRVCSGNHCCPAG